MGTYGRRDVEMADLVSLIVDKLDTVSPTLRIVISVLIPIPNIEFSLDCWAAKVKTTLNFVCSC